MKSRIDPHKHVHVAVAVDAARRQVGTPLTIKNGPHLVTGLVTWIRSISGDALVTRAIEDGHGFARRLADGLLLAGHEVVWGPTRLIMGHRKLHAATGPKSDPVDAAAVARAAIATPELTRHSAVCGVPAKQALFIGRIRSPSAAPLFGRKERDQWTRCHLRHRRIEMPLDYSLIPRRRDDS